MLIGLYGSLFLIWRFSMLSMFQYLIDVKNYSEYESEETVLRWEAGFDIPLKVHDDIKDYYIYRFSLINSD